MGVEETGNCMRHFTPTGFAEFPATLGATNVRVYLTAKLRDHRALFCHITLPGSTFQSTDQMHIHRAADLRDFHLHSTYMTLLDQKG